MQRNMVMTMLFIATLLTYAGGALADDSAGQRGPQGHLAGLDAAEAGGLNLELRNLADGIDIGYLDCQGVRGIEPAFGKLLQEAQSQELLGGRHGVYVVYHGDPYAEIDGDSPLKAAISLPAGAAVGGPIQTQTIPGGDYLVLKHRGHYIKLGQTLREFIAWAKEQHLAFDDRPVFEHFVTDPDSTPVKDWLTEIYFPLAKPADDDADGTETD